MARPRPRAVSRRRLGKTPTSVTGMVAQFTAAGSGLTTRTITGAMSAVVRQYVIGKRQRILFRRARRLMRDVSDDAALAVIEPSQAGRFLPKTKLSKGEEVWKISDKMRRKRRLAGGVQEARAFRRKDGSIAMVLAGELDESIRPLRKSLNIKDPATGAIQRVINKAKDFTSAMKRGAKLHWNGFQLVDFQRLHAWGHGFGDEARLGIAYAHKSFNLAWQNLGIENGLREIMRRVEGARIVLRVRLETFPPSAVVKDLPGGIKPARHGQGELLLESISYDFEVHVPGEEVMTGKVGLSTTPPGVPLKITPVSDGFVDPDLLQMFEDFNKKLDFD